MSVELDMRHTVVESGRRSCGVRCEVLSVRLWRATERDTVRSIAIQGGQNELYPVEFNFVGVVEVLSGRV